MKLTIELIPRTAWFNNLRNLVKKSQWDNIRKKVYQEANYKCEICGGVGHKHPVECHEIWEFTNNKIILKGLIALCPSCHEVKHIGRASVTGNLERAVEHFKKINNVSDEEAEVYIADAFKLYNERSSQEWEMDFDAIKGYL